VTGHVEPVAKIIAERDGVPAAGLVKPRKAVTGLRTSNTTTGSVTTIIPRAGEPNVRNFARTEAPIVNPLEGS